jgi:AcrR family transcriptional regulator
VTKREIRKKQITEKRQEQILKTAMTVFSQKGYTAATIPEIARLAGVAAGTIYLYYPSKRELFVSVIKNTIITVPLLNLLGQIQKADFPTVFKRIIQNRLSFAEGDKMVQISSLMSEIQRDPELKTLFLSKMFRPIMDMMEGFYRMGMAEGQLNQYEPKVVVRAIGGMIIGLLILKSVEGEEGPLSQLSRDEVSDDVVRLVLYGLMAGEDQKRVLNKRRRHEE